MSWDTAKLTHLYFGTVINELNSARIVGEESIFERGTNVPVTHLNFVKPPADDFSLNLKKMKLRSEKE